MVDLPALIILFFQVWQIAVSYTHLDVYKRQGYSHASIMYNVLTELAQVKKLVQLGIRDYCDEELKVIDESNGRIVTFFDKDIKERMYEGDTWKQIVDEVINHLPENVFISFDVDGLDPKLAPNTGTPVPGGFELEQIFYLFKKMKQAGKKIIGFDLNEIGVSPNQWDENVGARILYKLSSFFVSSQKS